MLNSFMDEFKKRWLVIVVQATLVLITGILLASFSRKYSEAKIQEQRIYQLETSKLDKDIFNQHSKDNEERLRKIENTQVNDMLEIKTTLADINAKMELLWGDKLTKVKNRKE